MITQYVEPQLHFEIFGKGRILEPGRWLIRDVFSLKVYFKLALTQVEFSKYPKSNKTVNPELSALQAGFGFEPDLASRDLASNCLAGAYVHKLVLVSTPICLLCTP